MLNRWRPQSGTRASSLNVLAIQKLGDAERLRTGIWLWLKNEASLHAYSTDLFLVRNG